MFPLCLASVPFLLDPSTVINLLIISCYISIALFVSLEVWQERQYGVSWLALAIVGILLGCTLDRGLHILTNLGLKYPAFWQNSFDWLIAIGAIACLGLRNRYWEFTQATQVLQTQKQLQQRNRELEQTVEQRTQELNQQSRRLDEILTELQRVQMNLIQLEKTSLLNQMVAGISYEIKNPINFISGNLPHMEEYIQDILRILQIYRENCSELNSAADQIKAGFEEAELDFILQDLPQVLNSIKLGTERIRYTVDNLENFYRPDEVGMKPINLHEGIESTLTLLQNRYKKKIEIVRQFEEIPLVECYINQLNQVFLNLISNSIEVLLNNEVVVPKRIVVATRRMGCDRVGVLISDNGMGMPQEVQEHLFEPFYTTKPTGVGTGLGLSISHQIVTQVHHGRMYCCSAPGEGTTFIIELPIQHAPLSPTKLPSCPADLETELEVKK